MYRYETVVYCYGCKQRLSGVVHFTCQNCGANPHDWPHIDHFAVGRFVWVPSSIKFCWYKPWTWVFVGHWEFDGIGRKEAAQADE